MRMTCGGEFEAERRPDNHGDDGAHDVRQRERQCQQQPADHGRHQQYVDRRGLTERQRNCRQARGKSERERSERE